MIYSLGDIRPRIHMKKKKSGSIMAWQLCVYICIAIYRPKRAVYIVYRFADSQLCNISFYDFACAQVVMMVTTMLWRCFSSCSFFFIYMYSYWRDFWSIDDDNGSRRVIISRCLLYIWNEFLLWWNGYCILRSVTVREMLTVICGKVICIRDESIWSA